MTIDSLIRSYQNLPTHECELLIAHVLKRDRLWVLTHPEYAISPKSLQLITKSLKKLKIGMPLAQIVGLKRFYDVDFIVNKHVLIPRQESEELVDLVASDIKSQKKITRIADIGTGSGCIGLILAKRFPKKEVFLLDNSKRALKVAQQNTDRLGLDVKVLLGDLLIPLKRTLPDIIVANLPYLSSEIYRSTSVSVRKFEPKRALYGGTDGLDIYRQLFRQIKKYYKGKKHPSIWLEISPEQEKILKKEKQNLHSPFSTCPERSRGVLHSSFSFHNDLSGRFRFVHISFAVDGLDNKDSDSRLA